MTFYKGWPPGACWAESPPRLRGHPGPAARIARAAQLSSPCRHQRGRDWSWLAPAKTTVLGVVSRGSRPRHVSCPSRGNKRTIARGAKGGLLPHLMMIACADVEETYGKRLTFCLLPLRISPLQTFILLVSTSRKPSMQVLIASLAAIRTEAAKYFQ